ncbi:Hint domain-containing protein [Fuscibacter oryzae]|uniref:Hint domain-containing protein n=1 Tax=Fuscibacter oryzae TaxID=2803939 RepID=A0A8J7MQP1_9RHOB|nr:Hint domain-containing protein [Fuscibacter oryzae]MBL4927104.1 Hint domain-containing protein [Fuscibacter oryzae]
MTRDTPDSPLPTQACQVLVADDIFVSLGVNQGEGMAGPDEVCAGDIYQIDPDHQPLRLVVESHPIAGQRIAAGSMVGHPGDPVTIEARYDLMGDPGDRVSLLLLSLPGAGRFVLPLSPMAMETDYTLVRTEAAPEASGLADLLCVSFLRGTMIALATGEQRAIEALRPGDRVLTRDHGGQPLLWVGKATLRAVGPFAPVVITAGTLGNAGDLIVSQHHRMFLYQRRKPEGLATSELLVQARHLVDGERIFVREGGFADYFSLVFDRHEIIYAEGVPAESLMVSETTLHRLPPELSEEVRARFPGLSQNQHFGTEAGRAFLDSVGPATLIAGRSRKPR